MAFPGYLYFYFYMKLISSLSNYRHQLLNNMTLFENNKTMSDMTTTLNCHQNSLAIFFSVARRLKRNEGIFKHISVVYNCNTVDSNKLDFAYLE